MSIGHLRVTSLERTVVDCAMMLSYQQALVLMDHAPEVEQVLKVLVPTPTSLAGTPTLAEVRWTRKVPFGSSSNNGAYFVGLKFLF